MLPPHCCPPLKACSSAPAWSGMLRCALVLLLGAVTGTARAEAPDGEKIYKSRCVRCHGRQGEGTKHYNNRLEGDRSVAQLAEVIRKTMPEDDPESLSAAEARAVATHVYDTFYSKLARERNRPARIELARLTARQYRHAVAD